jgi:hypothetical protein
MTILGTDQIKLDSVLRAEPSVAKAGRQACELVCAGLGPVTYRAYKAASLGPARIRVRGGHGGIGLFGAPSSSAQIDLYGSSNTRPVPGSWGG